MMDLVKEFSFLGVDMRVYASTEFQVLEDDGEGDYISLVEPILFGVIASNAGERRVYRKDGYPGGESASALAYIDNGGMTVYFGLSHEVDSFQDVLSVEVNHI